MRQLRTLLLLVAVAALLGGASSVAGAKPAPQVIRLIWVQTSNHPNGKGASWTSQLLNASPQFGRPAGAKVGAEVGIAHGAQLVGGIKLPGGVLEYSGKPKHLAHGGIVVPVVSGSGSYSGVSGTYTRSGEDPTIVVLRLQYD